MECPLYDLHEIPYCVGFRKQVQRCFSMQCLKTFHFQLMLFEEIRPNMLDRIDSLVRAVEHVVEELMDGDIIVFQKELSGNEVYRLPTSSDYFRELFYKV